MTRVPLVIATLLLLFLAAGRASAHGIPLETDGVSNAPTVSFAQGHSIGMADHQTTARSTAGGSSHGAAEHAGCNGACIPCCAAACGAPSALGVAGAMIPSVGPATCRETAALISQRDGLKPVPPSPPPRA